MFVSPTELGQLPPIDLTKLDTPALLAALLSGGNSRTLASKIIQEVEFRSQVSPSLTTRPFADDHGPKGASVDDRSFLAPKYELPADPTTVSAPTETPVASEPPLKDRLTRQALDFSRPSFYIKTPGGIVPIEPYGAPTTDNTGKVIFALSAAGLLIGFLTYKALKPCPSCWER